jgi:hypothetical protein
MAGGEQLQGPIKRKSLPPMAEGFPVFFSNYLELNAFLIFPT